MRATFRTAAVAAGAITALALPAAHAFAADAPTPGPASKETSKETKREALRTVKLEQGWTGKIYELAQYEGGEKSATLGYEADVMKGGNLQGTLKAHDGKGQAKSTTRTIGGVVFTLDFNGGLTAKGMTEGKGGQGRTLVKEHKNLGGSGFDARVHKTKGGYEADLLNGGSVRHTMKTDGKKADAAQHNGAHFVLNPDGTMKAWTEGGKPVAKPETKPAAKPETKPETKPVTPKGGVRAGAEGVGSPESSGEGTLLVAGSAGLAAAGAGGLGFALLRRHRTER